MTEPGEIRPPSWEVFAIDYDRRNVEWVLWGFTDDVEVYEGKVEANEGLFFLGDFVRAGELWQAFKDN